MIDRKYILLLLIVFGAALFISWPSSYVVPVSEETAKEIVYGDEFRNWSFRDQIELADVLQMLAIDEDPKIGDRPEKVREYIGELAGTVKYLKANNNTDIKIVDFGEAFHAQRVWEWSNQDSKDLPRIIEETRQKKKIDFTRHSQQVVVAYIALLKHGALESAVKGNNTVGVNIRF